MADLENREAVAILVRAPLLAKKTVRVNVTFSEEDLRAIDAHAEARGMTRSGFLLSAAKSVMKGARRSAA